MFLYGNIHFDLIIHKRRLLALEKYKQYRQSMSFVRAGKNAPFDLPTKKTRLKRKSSISQAFSAILAFGTALAIYTHVILRINY